MLKELLHSPFPSPECWGEAEFGRVPWCLGSEEGACSGQGGLSVALTFCFDDILGFLLFDSYFSIHSVDCSVIPLWHLDKRSVIRAMSDHSFKTAVEEEKLKESSTVRDTIRLFGRSLQLEQANILMKLFHSITAIQMKQSFKKWALKKPSNTSNSFRL